MILEEKAIQFYIHTHTQMATTGLCLITCEHRNHDYDFLLPPGGAM